MSRVFYFAVVIAAAGIITAGCIETFSKSSKSADFAGPVIGSFQDYKQESDVSLYYMFSRQWDKMYESQLRDSISNMYGPAIFEIKDDKWVEGLISEMTIEQKAAQLVFGYLWARAGDLTYKIKSRIEYLCEDIGVGGMIIFAVNPASISKIINEAQRLSKIPLIISSDFERGIARKLKDGTVFPYHMALGAADDASLTYQMGKVIARESRALGIHMNFAPVADINSNPKNPIINVRSYGESKYLVRKHSNALIRGMQYNKMIAVTKHFPGHGNTASDTHKDIVVANASKSFWFNHEMYPFRSNITNGVMAVLVSHLHVPAYENEKIPASLSKKIITDLLIKELEFKGLIVTDAMNMKAVTKYKTTGRAAIEAVLAGNDIILFPDDENEAINGIVEAVEKGEITEKRLDHSVRKILLAKLWLGLDKEKFVSNYNYKYKTGTKRHRELTEEIAEKSITLVKNENDLIPLTPLPDKVYTHIIMMDDNKTERANYFDNYMLEKIPGITSVILPKIRYYWRTDKQRELIQEKVDELYEDAYEAAENSDVIILSVYDKIFPKNITAELYEKHENFIDTLLLLNKPVILLGHRNPYLLAAHPDVSAYMCSYGPSEISEVALAKALFGEAPISGKLPVTIPGTKYEKGHGLEYDPEEKLLKGIDNPKFAEVNRLMKKAVSDSIFPGAVLLVAERGNIIYHKPFGHYTYDKSSPEMKTNTIFDLASVTKVIATTTSAMICIDRGLFSLEDTVAAYIPEFGNNGKEDILVKNLLLHNSGLPAFKPFYKNYTTEEEVINAIYSSRLEYKTGTKNVYSDLGIITLGKLIEKVSGKPLDVFAAEEIFKPLGMKNTMFNPPASLKGRCAPTEYDTYWRNRQLQGEVHDEAASLLNGVAGHAGLFSTAEDLFKILKMLKQLGFYKKRQYIDPDIVRNFIERQSDNNSRALGWDTNWRGRSSAGSKFSGVSFGHTGYTGTSVWVDPVKDIIVVLLTNRVQPTRSNTKIVSFRPVLHGAIMSAVKG